MPKVSIITPFYRGNTFIRSALEGIAGQTYGDFEYILVNDGSDEDPSQMVKELLGDRAIYLRQENKGQAAATNRGIAVAKGEYVAFCDQDDWWLPEKLEKQIAFLETHPEIAMVYTDALMADAEGKLLKKTWMHSRRVAPCAGAYGDCIAALFNRNFIPAQLAVLIRKSVFDSVGMFNEHFSSAYDYEYWFRVLEAGHAIGYIDEPLVVWRTHEGQESNNILKAKRMQVGILGEFLRRRKDFMVTYPVLVMKKIAKSYVRLGMSMLGK